jgi:hypothetical protein
MLIVFVVLSGYAVWKSERFQSLVFGVSQARLSQVLGVPVSFQTVEVSLLPPSLRLANVRIGNPPALGLPESPPLLEVQEVSVGGGISISGGELRLGRIHATGPRVHLVQLPDGRMNLPPGTGRPATGRGLKIVIRSLGVEDGSFDFNGRKAEVDGELVDFAADVTARGRDRYGGVLAARRAVVKMPSAEPIVFSLNTRFRLEPGHGFLFDRITLEGDFGRIGATGRVPVDPGSVVTATVTGRASIAEIEQLFRSDLGFEGEVVIDAHVQVPPRGDFRISGSLTSARVDAQGFLLEDVFAEITADRGTLLASIERASYAGGRAAGVLRIGNLTGDEEKAFTLSIDGKGISFERFFADVDLPGIGLTSTADLLVTLRWREGAGLERADGGGSLTLHPGPARSIVAGRHGLPASGSGGLSVVGGKIGFEGFVMRLPQSTVELSGGLRIGKWQPELGFAIRSEDFAEIDALYQNLTAALGDPPEALGLGGRGEARGSLEGDWANPRARIELTGSAARFSEVLFGDASGTIRIEDRAFHFEPLRIALDGGTGEVQGRLSFSTPPSGDRFDLRVEAERYPLAPLKEFFELDYPVEGVVTGAFPISGREESLRGGGPVNLEQAEVYGQKFDRIAGSLLFTPGKIALEEIRAERSGAVLTGRGDYTFDGEAYSFVAQAEKLPLEILDPLAEADLEEIDGLLTLRAQGEGTLARPNLQISATISEARFFGRTVPEDRAPRLEARIVEGRLAATVEAAGFWKITAAGDVTATPVALDLALEAPDLGALLALTPQPLPEPFTASISGAGRFTLSESDEGLPDGEFRISSVSLGTARERNALSASGITGRLTTGTLSLDEFEAVGSDSSLRLRLAVGLEGDTNALDAAATGRVGAATAGAFADLPATGVLRVDVRAEGSLQEPRLHGSIRLEDGRYQVEAFSQILENIEGSMTFEGTQVSIDGLRARFGGGEVFAAGIWEIGGDAPAHLTVRAQKVSLRLSRDARVQIDANLGISADETGYDVRGEINLLRASYLRDFELTLATLLQRGRRPAGETIEPWQEQTRLEVRVVSTAGLEVRNNLARITGSMDLLVRGTVARPRLYGQIFIDEGGRVTFRDQRYEMESGTITFAGSEEFAPILDLRARTEAGAYDVVVSIAGVWPRLQTTLTSDPPLPTGAIASLILTGEDPRASGAVTRDPSQSLASAAGDVVVGAAMSPISSGAQKLFGLDRFRIDPTFQGGTISSARATIGKQITPELYVSYSQSFNSNEQPVFEVEWRASRDLLVEALRDVYGNYILTVRRRQKL